MPEFCNPVKIYVIVTVILIIVACVVNILIDFYNRQGIIFALGKNSLITCCACLYTLVMTFAFMYLCTCRSGEITVWIILVLMVISCICGVFGNFFYGYSWNPVIV